MNVVRGYILGIIVCFTVLSIPAKVIYGYLFSIDTTAFIFDSFFSEPLCSDIQNYTQAALVENRFSLCDSIKKDYSMIKAVCVRQARPHSFCFSVKAYEPIFLLTNEKVILENGILTDKANFIGESTQNLFSLTIQEQKDSMIPPEALLWLNAISDEVFHRYHVLWLDKTRIVLNDIQQSHIQLLCDYTTILDKQVLSYCSSVLESYKNLNGKRQGIIADLRFKDQIVVYRKRGDHEKYRIF